MQQLLTTSDFMLSTYDSLPTTAKITVLDILAAMLSNAEGPSNATATPTPVSQEESDRKSTVVPMFTLAYLAEQFEDLAKGVMKLITEEQSRLSTEEMVSDLGKISFTFWHYVQATYILATYSYWAYVI